jgi:hypothetical protein
MSGMRIEVLMVANAAATDGSLLNVQGGGWEYCSPAMLPCTVEGAVAGVATLADDEIGTTPALNIAITDGDGQDAGFAASMIVSGIRPSTVPGVPVRVPFAVAFTFAASRSTVVKAAVIHEHAELAAVTFLIRDPVPDAPPQG